MGKLSTFIIIAMLSVSVSGFFKGKSHSEPSEHYEWSEAPKYETIHVEHGHEHHYEHYEKGKKDKKWSWLPSWPWKKNKESSHETHHKIKHFPLFKLQKVKVRPVHEVQPVIYHHYSSPHEEVPSPVYHHETVELVKEVPSPVYHHEVHTEISGHSSPVYHHPAKEEIHEVHEEESKWKWPELGASQWSQLETEHSSFDEQSNEEAAKEIISSFLGEGHSIDTLEKLMPTLHKDKNLFNKLKQFHHLKSWLPTLKKSEEHHGHEDKKSKTLFNFLPKMFKSQSVEHVPQVIETHHEHTAPQHFPIIHEQSFHVPNLPYIPVAYPIHQTVSTTVIEHPKKVYEIEHYKPEIKETKKEELHYEQHTSHNSHQYSHQLHNSYGEPIPNDSYSSASEQNQVVLPPPIPQNAEQHFSDAVQSESNNQQQDSITLKSAQRQDSTK